MLTVTTYLGVTRICDGCGLVHLLPGTNVYLLRTPEHRLMIARSCVIDNAPNLTRVVCSALSDSDYELLLVCLGEHHAAAVDVVSGAEPSLLDAVTGKHKIVLSHQAVCGWCNAPLKGKPAARPLDDICEFCAAALRGW